MQQIFFILGRDPQLSSAEIRSIFTREKSDFSIISSSREVLIVKAEKENDLKGLMEKMGGVIKIGEVIDEVKYEDSEDKFDRILSSENLLEKYVGKIKGKIHFGVSIYRGDENNPYVAQLVKRQKNLHVQIKDNLKNAGRSAGFVQIKDRFLSSVSVEKNGLLIDGAEIVLIPAETGIFAGKTLSVQDFASFSFRDFNRPGKDKRSGIMPPKMARMMVNISGINTGQVLLDPFCGSGTIIQESISLGIKRIIGTDISARAISDTTRNIDWYFNNFRTVDRKFYDLKIRKAEVGDLGKILPPGSVDAVVTEPYLGPPLHRRPEAKQAERLIQEITPLYLRAFSQFAGILKKSGIVVIIFPAFDTGREFRYLDIIDRLEQMGFVPDGSIIAGLENTSDTQNHTRKSILTGDKYSFLKREIFRFIKN